MVWIFTPKLLAYEIIFHKRFALYTTVKLTIFTILFFLITWNSALYSQKVTYNHIVESLNSDTKKVKQLFENYISSNPANLKNSKYWSLEEQRSNNKFDFLESEFQPSLYMGLPVHVLSIKSIHGLYEIKAQFSYCKEDGTPYILAIVNYYAKKENGEFKLFNALSINKLDWNCTNLGLVDYYYPKYYHFDIKKAEELNLFMQKICKNLDVKPKPFEYYMADDYDEIQTLKGIDYYIGMGGEASPKGKASDNKAYCGGLGENYFHEVFHVQIDESYPNKHFWVSEGLATFLGGSRGRELEWHLKKVNAYLLKHPELNLNDLLDLKNMDELTSFHYAIGGFLARSIYEKGDWAMIKDFMNSGSEDQNYYEAIEKYLGIKRTQLNDYLRKEIKASLQK
tara:strand:- start:25896 stop:27083 length:1188 start_codon:yes stop_codon:yes gene_type:complete